VVDAAIALAPVDDVDAFRAFVGGVEPSLRRALVAAYGADLGREATADALAWAWQHWPRVQSMTNAPGYLWRVGQTSVRRSTRRRKREVIGAIREIELVAVDGESIREPRLSGALDSLSPQQRAAVVLVHGHGMSLSEAGTALGCSVSTVRNHVARALRHLRAALGGTDG
jgi:RNA polymerase sigma factor (sigma-70 family)